MAQSLGTIDSFIEAIDSATSLEVIFSNLAYRITRLGFEYFAYELVWPAYVGQSFYHTNYPTDWLKYYIEKRYSRDDIICRQTAQRVRPFLWPEVTESRFLTKQQTKVMNEWREAGLLTGASVPMHGPGKAEAYLVLACKMSDEAFEKLFIHRRHELYLISMYAHERILALKPAQFPSGEDNKLTPREIEILTWAALGKERSDIAQILSIGDETVKSHIANACIKLDVNNKTHAVARALVQGLIVL